MKNRFCALARLRTPLAFLWVALGLLAVLAFGPSPAQAAVTEAWVQRYTNNGSAHAHAVAVDSSGNVVVTGYSDRSPYNHDFYTAKYSTDGVLLWEQRYNGPANSDDSAEAVAVDNSGNVVVTGFSYNGTNSDYYTVKYAAMNGALLWEKRYNGPANYHDNARAVVVDSSGNVVVTGSSDNDYYTLKYAAADGALLWEQRYNGPANSGDYAQAVAVDGSGNVLVTGYSWNTNFTNLDCYTAKYAVADGALLWDKRYDGPANSDDRATAVAVDGSGNVVVTGFSHKGGFPFTDIDYYTAKYAAANGALLWERHHNGWLDELDYTVGALAVDGDGNVVVTGSFMGSGGSADYYTAKYAATDGALLWETRYNSPANGTDLAHAVAVDGSGNVVVAGFSEGDYYTAKYAATDGALLWEIHYHDPANASYSANSLALGPNGMVAVTGSADNFWGTGKAWTTVVYRENLPPVSIDLVPTGIRLRFTGIPDRSYAIERAPAVTGPWTTLATPTAPTGGLIEYVDTNPPAGTGFYRTSAP